MPMMIYITYPQFHDCPANPYPEMTHVFLRHYLQDRCLQLVSGHSPDECFLSITRSALGTHVKVKGPRYSWKQKICDFAIWLPAQVDGVEGYLYLLGQAFADIFEDFKADHYFRECSVFLNDAQAGPAS